MPHIDMISTGDQINQEFKKVVQNKIGTSDNLLDSADGGTGFCEFKFYQKMQIKKKLHHVIHFVEIKPLDILDDSSWTVPQL